MPSRRNDPREWNLESLVDERTQSIRGRLQNPWKYIYSNVAPYSAEIFTHVALELIHHPERNSKNIRRADILYDTDLNPDVPLNSETADGQCVTGMRCIRTIHRRLMPRNPNLDDELEQTCRFYAADDDFEATLVTYYCHFVNGKVPYYVPDVLGIGFELFEGRVYIAYLPLSSHDCTSDRLLRVALNLLRTFHRHWYYTLLLS
jgi:tRNASer (uridine44-2'-O)-methyltransferase